MIGDAPTAEAPVEIAEDSQTIAVSARTAAALFETSLRNWSGLDAAGQVPAPIRVGHRKRWQLDELRAWAAAGAPSRARWQVIKDSQPGLKATWPPETERRSVGVT